DRQAALPPAARLPASRTRRRCRRAASRTTLAPELCAVLASWCSSPPPAQLVGHGRPAVTSGCMSVQSCVQAGRVQRLWPRENLHGAFFCHCLGKRWRGGGMLGVRDVDRRLRGDLAGGMATSASGAMRVRGTPRGVTIVPHPPRALVTFFERRMFLT